MLYYKFKNYDEFKELFGVTKHGNGAKSRKNKILLSFLKNKKLLHDATTSGDYELLHISTMAELKQTILRKIQESGEWDNNLRHRLKLHNRTFYSAIYETDNYNGICEDGEWYHVNDIETCAKCGNDYVADDGYYSELTEEHYCDSECYSYGEDDYKEANWHWSEFDEEWFKDESSVVKYMRWSRYLGAYEENTISVDSLNEKVDASEFYLIEGTYYNDIDTETMLPFN